VKIYYFIVEEIIASLNQLIVIKDHPTLINNVYAYTGTGTGTSSERGGCNALTDIRGTAGMRALRTFDR
jgi:hypothetical protein